MSKNCFKVYADVETESCGDVTMESLFVLDGGFFEDICAFKDGQPVDLNKLSIDDFNFAMARLEDAVADHE